MNGTESVPHISLAVQPSTQSSSSSPEAHPEGPLLFHQ